MQKPIQSGPYLLPTVETNQNVSQTAHDRLNRLIGANRSTIDLYQTTAERLEIEGNKALLQNAAEKHETFVIELSNLLAGYSGSPDTGIDGSGLLKRTWVNLKAVFTDGDGPLLAEAAREAEKILDAYREAMSEDLPDEARTLIRRHVSEARVIQDKLTPLSAIYNKS